MFQLLLIDAMELQQVALLVCDNVVWPALYTCVIDSRLPDLSYKRVSPRVSTSVRFVLRVLEFMFTCCVTHITNVAALEMGCECFILYSLSRSTYLSFIR